MPKKQKTNIYKMEEIKKHDSRESCWMVIGMRVYDVTEYIDQHQGGDLILDGCGKDATSIYATQGGTYGSHSPEAAKILQKYYIGDIER